MNEATIVTNPVLPFRMVNSHLIVGATGCVVVDTGTPGSEDKIGRALKGTGSYTRRRSAHAQYPFYSPGQ